MVQRLHQGGVCLADGPPGPAAPRVPAENTHQDREGKPTERLSRLQMTAGINASTGLAC